MSEPFRSLFTVALGAWIGAVAVAILAKALLFRRHGRASAWTPCSTLLPLTDLPGQWAGRPPAWPPRRPPLPRTAPARTGAAPLAPPALSLGRRGFGFAWSSALFLVALAVTASLYDRAVLMPSLDAAFKRMQADDDPKWEEEWRFLWAMARWGRTATLAAAAGAAVLGLAA